MPLSEGSFPFVLAFVCVIFVLVPSSKEVLQKGASGHWQAFQRVLAEEDGGLQLLDLLLLLLDLGLQRVAEGLGPCATEGEYGLVLLLLGFSLSARDVWLLHAAYWSGEPGCSHTAIQRINLSLLLARGTDAGKMHGRNPLHH